RAHRRLPRRRAGRRRQLTCGYKDRPIKSLAAAGRGAILPGMEHASPQPLAPSRAAPPAAAPAAARGDGRDTAQAPVHPGYAGDIAPGEAWQLVQSGQATLVDVRTAEELHWVGRVPGAVHVE